VAKKKTKANSRELLVLDDMSEVEWASLCLTHFIGVLKPELSDGETYNVVYSLLMERELSPEVAEEYGEMLRATLEMPTGTQVH
jgi:hypothetical protein